MIAGWSPGIGDPTLMGWLTVVGYLAACLATWRAASRDMPVNARVWLGISVFLGLLAINKQLDLQSLLTAVAREQAQTGGWYDNRRAIQQELILTLVAAFGVLIIGLFYLTRRRGRALRGAICGISFLALFVCVRAISFHNMDAFIGLSFLAMSMNHFLELGGIALTGASALAVRPPLRVDTP